MLAVVHIHRTYLHKQQYRKDNIKARKNNIVHHRHYLRSGCVPSACDCSGHIARGVGGGRKLCGKAKSSCKCRSHSLGEALLAPTKIYVKTLKEIKNAGVKIKGCSHITGGGFYENVPRMLHDGVHAVIEKNSYEVPAIFKMLQNDGEIEEKMMYNTFNMGIGMVLAVDPADADKVLAAVAKAGETGYVIGRVEAGEKGVTVC